MQRETNNYTAHFTNKYLSQTATSFTIKSQKDLDELRNTAQERSEWSERAPRTQEDVKAFTLDEQVASGSRSSHTLYPFIWDGTGNRFSFFLQ
ncbi:hypothetical protein ElyMa_000453000 [Elysia marginata]|uniref:Uncharacterized protein n=1 Tax=Elysia marginata TaxID=1093978 RepID=A0AAV4FQH8_9GAST|nr:hypothetical protein ElyMa_000453000 [Elysia marginata]